MRRKRGFHAPQGYVPNTRYHLFFLPILLSLIGLYFIFESSGVEGAEKFKDSFFYVRAQATSLVISIVAMLVMTQVKLDFLKKQAFNLMFVAIVLLVAVLIPGIGTKILGARRWIVLPFFSIQPVELAKFAAILYCSAWFMVKEQKRFTSFITLAGIIFGLVMLQPDMGSAGILVAVMIGLYIVSGNELRPLLMSAVPILALGAILVFTSPYRMRRLQTLIDPSSDPLGTSYHINQIYIALQSGGLWGNGIGLSKQKFLYLPEAQSDSIFAIVAEDLGFFGSVIVIGVFMLFLYSIYALILRTNNPFARLVASGILIYFGAQIIINLASVTGLFPLTGVPLPFFSFGGTHLLVSFVLVGILLQISRNHATK